MALWVLTPSTFTAGNPRRTRRHSGEDLEFRSRRSADGLWRKTAGSLAAIFLVFLQGTPLSASEGFLGYAWGTQFSYIERRFDLTLIARSGSHATYATNVRRLDDAEVDECHLEFVHARLAGVVLLTRGKENSHRLLTYLRKHLGDGQRSDPNAYTWLSGGVHVSFDVDSYGDGYLYWYSLYYQQE